jgi:hypothetical protein
MLALQKKRQLMLKTQGRLMAEAKARESPHPVKPVQMTAWSFA